MNKDKQQIEALSNDLLKSEFWRFDEECNRFELDRTKTARNLHRKGYRKAADVALYTVDDFQSKLRHIFLDMCEGNDYNTVNLLQIDSAIEALFDSFVAELKKKYTEGANDQRRN